VIAKAIDAAALAVIRPTRANQFDQFAPIHLARPALNGAKSPAPKNQFRERIQADWGVSPDAKNIRFPKTRNCGTFQPSRSHKRGVGHRHERWVRDAMDAGGVARRAIPTRTAKPCGPGAPTLASSRKGQYPRRSLCRGCNNIFVPLMEPHF
jgi:hypothetical protein